MVPAIRKEIKNAREQGPPNSKDKKLCLGVRSRMQKVSSSINLAQCDSNQIDLLYCYDSTVHTFLPCIWLMYMQMYMLFKLCIIYTENLWSRWQCVDRHILSREIQTREVQTRRKIICTGRKGTGKKSETGWWIWGFRRRVDPFTQ